MGIEATRWVWKHSQAEGTDRLVLLALADFAAFHEGDEHPTCWPAKRTIGQMLKLSDNTIRKSLRNLEALGEITMAPFTGWEGRPDRRPNRYTFVHIEEWSGGSSVYPRETNGGSSESERGLVSEQNGGSYTRPKPLLEPLKNRANDFSEEENQPPAPVEPDGKLPDSVKQSGRAAIADARSKLTPGA